MHKTMRITVALLAIAAVGPHAVWANDIVLEVVGGRSPAGNRIVEQDLDLEALAELTGQAVVIDPAAVRVVELGAAGETLDTMLSQVDPAALPGRYTVCWQIAGELGAGQTRRFRVVVDGRGPVPAPAQPITATIDGGVVTVASGGRTVVYDKDTGGMPVEVGINGASGRLAWGDKIYDGTEYRLANHGADSVRLLAVGPLRAVYETASRYRSGTAVAASAPRAVYRFTHYAGEPVVRLEAKIAQDFGHQWISVHFVEINFANAPVTYYATDGPGGVLKQAGSFHSGQKWAAVYGDQLFLGVCDASSPGVYDGGGRHYWSYLRSGTAPMMELEQTWRCALFLGSGQSDLEGLQDWHRVLSDAPVVRVKVAQLDEQIAQLKVLTDERRQALDRLDGSRWIGAYVRILVAENMLQRAAADAARGALGAAATALVPIRDRLRAGRARVRSRSSRSVLSGTADGYPFIANDRAAYVWARPDDGAGLISVYDRRNGREYLSVEPRTAPFWEVSTKKGDGGAAHVSTGGSCRVRTVRGGLDFTWDGALAVRVRARLAADEALLRMRLRADLRQADESILNVAFPVVDGIMPISANGTADVVLDTWAVGQLRQSPLLSGKPVENQYPHGMQFTALQADERGLYFAAEDPDANRKTLAWSAGTGGLRFRISRPVLGWAGPDPARRYASPGDVVVGPFRGDWYDAAQLYRRWAITAPWCAKGPIHARPDVPKWLADASYWTIGQLGDRNGIRREMEKHEFFGLPTGVIHAYGYYMSPQQDNLYPEVWPPKLGSEDFRRAVADLQAIGMRVVPYISGSLWDEDTESYRTEMASERGALINTSGDRTVLTAYGGGQRLVCMCPGSQLWQDKLAAICREGVERYGVDGWYFDFLTIHTADCFNREHGHPLAGGNFWTRSVRDLYTRLRTELKAVNPDVMMTGEDNAEFVIDLLDTALSLGKVGTRAPLYQAVYHDYTMLFGGQMNRTAPCIQGRWWLLGNQNGWHNIEHAYADPPNDTFRRDGEYYRGLLRCHHEFGRPYLVYGRMLRMPRVTGDLPTVTGQSSYGPYTIPAVEGSAWQAPDGSVGIFFLNYADEPQQFEWAVDLEEGAAWSEQTRIQVAEWTAAAGLQTGAEIRGGSLQQRAEIEGRGLIALKLAPVR